MKKCTENNILLYKRHEYQMTRSTFSNLHDIRIHGTVMEPDQQLVPHCYSSFDTSSCWKKGVTMVQLLAKDFERAATVALKCTSITPAVFVSFFGASPVVVASAWRRMKRKLLLSNDQRPRHLLWALAFLKQYSTENVLARQLGTNVRTYRDHVWRMINCLSRIGNVSTSC